MDFINDEDISRISILKEMLQQTEHNILCYSDSYLCTKPKKQYIKEFMDIADELNELNDYVDEDMIRINKGKIRRKVNIPSLT